MNPHKLLKNDGTIVTEIVKSVRVITVPILIFGMGGHYFLRDNEVHYEVSASSDKEYVIVEGASHGIRPCRPCETTPGQYGNSVKNTFDHMQKWINARFN